METDLSITSAGLRFPNPFILASGPPGDSLEKIRKAFEAGWGGIVTKTIGVQKARNVPGPIIKFLYAASGAGLSMRKSRDASPVASWNWESYSDRDLETWVSWIKQIKQEFPDRILIASIMAGSGSAEELRNWQDLVAACREAGADALELNISCPHMARADMGSNIGRNRHLVFEIVKAVKDVAGIPVFVKPSSNSDIMAQAEAAFEAGAEAISSSNTYTALPLINPDTLEFEMNVDGLTSTGGLGGQAILPLSLARMAQLTGAFPEKEFCGIGGIRTFRDSLNYFAQGCGTVQICTEAILDKAYGPNIIQDLLKDLSAFLARHKLENVQELVSLRRSRIVDHAQIRRSPDSDPAPV